MIRLLVGFIFGTFLSYLAIYLLLTLATHAISGPESREEIAFPSPSTIAKYQSIHLVCAFGSLVGGAIAAMALNYPLIRRGQNARRRSHADQTLTTAEFQRVFQTCQWIPASEGAEYLRGFIVGRLAETAPTIAKKVDNIDACHMAAICADLQNNQVAGELTRGFLVIAPPTNAEVRALRNALLGFDIDGRPSDYVRGLLVGRLVESQPALARKARDLGRAQLVVIRSFMDDFDL